MTDRLHIVKEGEWMTSIAHKYGFASGNEIYEYDKNAPLRELRSDPDVIYPGDEVWIPPCPYEVEVELPSTGGQASWKVVGEKPQPETLDMVIRDDQDEPLANMDYVLRIGGYSKEGTTDGDGRLVEEFDRKLLGFGTYSLQVGEAVIPLEIGRLDPLETTKGLQARLNNLGYECGPVDGQTSAQTRGALRAFQKDNGLEADGVATKKTRDKLKEVYGG